MELLSNPDLMAASDRGISDNSNFSSSEKVRGYSAAAKTGRTRCSVRSNSFSDTKSVTCSSASEENRNLHPVRARRKHGLLLVVLTLKLYRQLVLVSFILDLYIFCDFHPNHFLNFIIYITFIITA